MLVTLNKCFNLYENLEEFKFYLIVFLIRKLLDVIQGDASIYEKWGPRQVSLSWDERELASRLPPCTQGSWDNDLRVHFSCLDFLKLMRRVCPPSSETSLNAAASTGCELDAARRAGCTLTHLFLLLEIQSEISVDACWWQCLFPKLHASIITSLRSSLDIVGRGTN